jgi:undecaprenyl-diphosphatase
MTQWIQILILAVVQGAAELLPVSSSAHVIVAEKLMGLDPSRPDMTFLLVMLHTGTMFAVLVYFWKRWATLLDIGYLKALAIATIATGILGFGLKKAIEKFLLHSGNAADKAEIESLFRNLPLIAASLFAAGIVILVASRAKAANKELSPGASLKIGLMQGLCLPFRGFSRSGATISTGLMLGISREAAENFSFALAVILTPPVVGYEFLRLVKHAHAEGVALDWSAMLIPGLVGMVASFGAGLLALKWLSSWLENGKWKFFGIYCLVAAAAIFALSFVL